MASAQGQVAVNNRRRRLERILVKSTRSFPNQCDISRARLQYLDNIFNRSIPSDDEALAKDDKARRSAVHEIIAARVEAGFDTKEQEKRWRYIIDMERQAKHTPWQQRQFIVATLEERNDRERVVSAERWLRESASLRRLLNETIEALDSGKAQRRRIDDLQRALSSANTGTSMKLRQQRRDAVITLLRIRRDAGFQGQPELEYRWNSIDLLALVEMTKEELEGSKEAGADMLFSVEDEGPAKDDYVESRRGRETVPSPSPDPADQSVTPTPSSLHQEFTPVPLSPLALEE